MLMFVFGAGASFDSDPARRPRPGSHDVDDVCRPPLAAGLFDPRGNAGGNAVAAFSRAAPLLMRLREATQRGLEVEQVLEQLQEDGAKYPLSASQLLSLRAYLAQLLSNVPGQWNTQCRGLTNYVLALDEAARWNAAVHGDSEPVACVSFNYDTLLEEAVQRVFGWRISDINAYVAHPSVKLFKPHGSVNWRQVASWDPGSFFSGRGALDVAIDRADQLEWTSEYLVEVGERYQDSRDTTRALLPALTIPVQRKADFMMPERHRHTLVSTLERVTTLVAVGWRARERHFLQLLQDHLPSAPGRLVAVAESDNGAQETINNMWQTGRFDRYVASTLGFSGFAETPAASPDPEDAQGVRLRDVLTASGCTWTTRRPGTGVPASVEDPLEAAPYVDL